MTDDKTRDAWLHGWPRVGNTAIVGTSVRCIGCGRNFGVTRVAIPAGYVCPTSDPGWPFDEATCPVHNQREPEAIKFDSWPPRVAELYERWRKAEHELAAMKTRDRLAAPTPPR